MSSAEGCDSFVFECMRSGATVRGCEAAAGALRVRDSYCASLCTNVGETLEDLCEQFVRRGSAKPRVCDERRIVAATRQAVEANEGVVRASRAQPVARVRRAKRGGRLWVCGCVASEGCRNSVVGV